MADFGKIKKNRFGDVPGEPSGNLKAKENPTQSRAKAERTEPLNFKVAPEFKKAFRQAALDEGLKLVELLEVCFEQRRQGRFNESKK
ncbi:hypothetical protein [Candidatus Electronema sp. PJ]|uniref:hypothetical protein n=1 Tax=Candidatus Electronema sp. PJ TaxID=3401572 RepID=UPI003AA7CA43